MDPFYLSIVFVLLTLILVVLEFFIPSAGILGVLAFVCALVSIITGFMSSMEQGVLTMVGYVILLPILFWAVVRIWPHTFFGRRLFGHPPKEKDILPHTQFVEELQNLIGRVGVAKTPMLLSGQVIVDGKKYDAISDGEPIDPGQAIVVVNVDMRRLLVRQQVKPPVVKDAIESGDQLSKSIEELGLGNLDFDQK